jgi:citrate lyase subunit beta/citryl-CoA lyase
MRSMLFASGNNVVHCEKAIRSPADAVILDLEDSVEVGAKPEARSNVAAILDKHSAEARPIVVRINAMSTDFAYGDVLAVVRQGTYAIMLPKTESDHELRTLDWLISQIERSSDLPAGAIAIIPIVETATGFDQLRRIARASGRVPYLSFGAGDYSLDIGARNATDSPALASAKVQLVNTSRSAGLLPPIDSVFGGVSNADELRTQARLAHDLGFQGKACIHPTQIEVIHAEFAPSPDELSQARRIVTAFEEAKERGVAAILVDSWLVDYPIAEHARRLLESAENTPSAS